MAVTVVDDFPMSLWSKLNTSTIPTDYGGLALLQFSYTHSCEPRAQLLKSIVSCGTFNTLCLPRSGGWYKQTWGLSLALPCLRNGNSQRQLQQ